MNEPDAAVPSADVDRPALVAYVVTGAASMSIVPSTAHRAWMSATPDGFAKRCLPLLMANQHGWFVLSSHTVEATWDGGPLPANVTVRYLEGPSACPAASHFGSGILTFQLPYLFRTSPGYNLLVRGPANWPKDGACALEGLVETDWNPASFTMNWQLTRRGHPVRFNVGEPIAMIVPQGRGELERFQPEVRALSANPELDAQYRDWHVRRTDFNANLHSGEPDATRRAWQREYTVGKFHSGASCPQHQTKLALAQFTLGREPGGE